MLKRVRNFVDNLGPVTLEQIEMEFETDLPLEEIRRAIAHLIDHGEIVKTPAFHEAYDSPERT